MMSISPEAGQLGPNIQNAGHVPQIPPGMCAISAMKSPCAGGLLAWQRNMALGGGGGGGVLTEGCIAAQSDGSSSSSGVLGRVVHPEVDLAVLVFGQTIAVSSCF